MGLESVGGAGTDLLLPEDGNSEYQKVNHINESGVAARVVVQDWNGENAILCEGLDRVKDHPNRISTKRLTEKTSRKGVFFPAV